MNGERDELRDVESTVSPKEQRAEHFRRRNFVRPNVDIYSTESDMVVVGDLPGVHKSDLDITIERDDLVIEAPVAGRAEAESALPWGYYRRFRLRTNFDRDRISAHMEGGVLTVTLPKAASEKTRKVSVE
ncbi:MAG: Hsp20/alpha crystallin family protein [Gemmatimonadetes bacterium]|uniref:Hsp20/alpha crystallin family protein n=1 Tax=Candidatus Kutchimonas denitrificans TaxID=3056748 RepID=A0AAE5CCV4_9BACT|nr:Hsp20/alpha crystallin family protein [Gemmatimonadota bacterium]NIR76185.1 Hsp20/alpha crystallin family protein [Candidatus Kutchimonas denitrificans]NIS00625.1 Hsp20/alpha crystallin family protein [Gemmatimonadota bacterium]NIT66770.1 Hsp20/alpha crystallin family protein [Gemmatimonadota bacterium]NIV23369.1 Hsp20 family protein [Gemmatimonadota bacterium]